MIRPLRRLHRRMIALLAVGLVALFVASQVARKPVPANPKIPAALLPAPAIGQR